MIQIDGRYYFINFENIDKVLNNGLGATEERELEESQTELIMNGEGEVVSQTINKTKSHKPREVNAFRYQVISAMLDELIHGTTVEGDGGDEYIKKNELDKLPLGVRLSFNTLLEYGIISFIEL